MDRRKALKNMGLALGYTVATPTLIGIVQSCKQETAIKWVPEFLSSSESKVVIQLIDIILPKTDTPSASEVQVHQFIDRFAKQVMPTEQQNFFKMAMGHFMDKAKSVSGKENAEDLTAEDLEPVLASALKVVSKEQEETNGKAIQAYNEAIAAGNEATLDADVASSAFANNLRGITIWGYKTSEYVGEEVLAYLPLPGKYVACGDVEELSGGKAWSL